MKSSELSLAKNLNNVHWELMKDSFDIALGLRVRAVQLSDTGYSDVWQLKVYF